MLIVVASYRFPMTTCSGSRLFSTFTGPVIDSMSPKLLIGLTEKMPAMAAKVLNVLTVGNKHNHA